MGKAGRVACIFTPYVLTIASLICIIMVGLGCTKASSDTLNNLYFIRLDLSNISTGSAITSEITDRLNDLHITSVTAAEIEETIKTFQNDADIADFYDIGLWGYCEGNSTKGKDTVSSCTDPKAQFYFNPSSILGVSETQLEKELGSGFKKTLNIYKAVSKWMFIAYLVAFIATCAQVLLGIFAIFSRWGSCVTTIVSIVSFLFTLGASLTSTIMFSIAKGSIGTALKVYGVEVDLGKNIYIATWFAVAFSLGATIFWMFSTCCCSGRSPYGHKDRHDTRSVTAEKAPYTYEPIGAAHPPYGSPQPYAPQHGYSTSYPPTPNHNNDIPMTHNNQQSSAYEPFRHS
ncbi:Actin cortical patch SUR7/pH-response regulator PalI [Penicillium concentricum]|uniref:Actin cortical patch SUR7/pH-response regulator PalI n=1 Tax=Penicillium concentricum TaxID=293559 RepID=A0A9W9VLP6_9EURO|nr:Actin cortical patch SUR7/pH-response regulator PalI [Penicillium concentricum]KAJ5385061.1 Actin cortical patch SUR7/pH-response regulator PalI [Penicillium concentricum]